MTMRGEIIKNMLLGLAGTVVMICLAVSLTVWFRPLYYFDIDYLDIPAKLRCVRRALQAEL